MHFGAYLLLMMPSVCSKLESIKDFIKILISKGMDGLTSLRFDWSGDSPLSFAFGAVMKLHVEQRSRLHWVSHSQLWHLQTGTLCRWWECDVIKFICALYKHTAYSKYCLITFQRKSVYLVSRRTCLHFFSCCHLWWAWTVSLSFWVPSSSGGDGSHCSSSRSFSEQWSGHTSSSAQKKADRRSQRVPSCCPFAVKSCVGYGWAVKGSYQYFGPLTAQWHLSFDTHRCSRSRTWRSSAGRRTLIGSAVIHCCAEVAECWSTSDCGCIRTA